MKKLILATIVALFAISAKAQSNAEEIALMQSVYGMQKRNSLQNT